MDDRPRISIGMPVFNGGRFLRDAVDSILSQTFRDFELIISDNASTDDTEKICQQYCGQDARIRYERLSKNCGAIENFNRLVGLSRGEFFKWAAADDTCLPNYLEEMVKILDEDPGVAWCHSQTVKINEHGRILEPTDPEACGLARSVDAGMPRKNYDSAFPHKRFNGVLLGTSWSSDVYGLIRIEILRKTGLIAKCFGSEKVLMAELSLHGRYREYPETLSLHRVHPHTAGNLKSIKGQQVYTLGDAKPIKFDFSRLTLLREYLKAVRRAPLGFRDRVFCYMGCVAYVFQFHKWLHVATAFVRQKPLKEYSKVKAVSLPSPLKR